MTLPIKQLKCHGIDLAATLERVVADDRPRRCEIVEHSCSRCHTADVDHQGLARIAKYTEEDSRDEQSSRSKHSRSRFFDDAPAVDSNDDAEEDRN
jgi:hypothetical protein